MRRLIVLSPENKDQALQMASGGQAMYYGGGIDILRLTRRETADEPLALIPLSGLRELTDIRREGGDLQIGGAATYQQVLESEESKNYPLLRKALSCIGCEAIRNQGTIGGALGGSAPFLDVLPPLLVLSALLNVERPGYSRLIDLPGYLAGHNVTERGTLISRILIPSREDPLRWIDSFQRITHRRGMDVSALNVAAIIGAQDDGTIVESRWAFGGSALSSVIHPEDIGSSLIGETVGGAWERGVYEKAWKQLLQAGCSDGLRETVEWLVFQTKQQFLTSLSGKEVRNI